MTQDELSDQEAGVAPCPYHGGPQGWIEIRLVAENGAPVADVRYRVVLPDGAERRGKLDAQGCAFIGGFPEGTCRVAFPDLDGEVWRALDGTALAPADPPPDLRRSDRHHTVERGDCISSLAHASGHRWRTIWEHAENAALRDVRDDPDVLNPGDRVFIPALRYQEATCPSGATYRFEHREAGARLRLVVRDGNRRPMPGLDYLLDVDGVLASGALDDAARIDEPIPPNAKAGVLELYDRTRTLLARMGFRLGEMDPVTTERGVAERLQNLGFGACDESDALTDAIAHFQALHLGPEHVTGEMNDETRAKLIEVYAASI